MNPVKIKSANYVLIVGISIRSIVNTSSVSIVEKKQCTNSVRSINGTMGLKSEEILASTKKTEVTEIFSENDQELRVLLDRFLVLFCFHFVRVLCLPSVYLECYTFSN